MAYKQRTSLEATSLICLLLCLVSSSGASLVARQANLSPILTTLKDTPDLSRFYSLFSSTGGSSGIPAPDFEERFNNIAREDLEFTVFAPTNDAFDALLPELINTLTSILAYPLLATLLRNHMAQGNFTPQDLTTASQPIDAVGGFSLSFDQDGNITTNQGLTESDVQIGSQARLLRGESGRISPVPASNGAVYRIDNILDSFTTYFGVDAQQHALPPIRRQSGTMADILRQNENLSYLSAAMEALDPDFVPRLSLFSEDDRVNKDTVYLAPSNRAFEYLPGGARQVETDPSSGATSLFLLEQGFGAYDEAQDRVVSVNGFNVSIVQGNANNAAVEERVCVENGCVWIIRRWLDPFFGVF